MMGEMLKTQPIQFNYNACFALKLVYRLIEGKC